MTGPERRVAATPELRLCPATLADEDRRVLRALTGNGALAHLTAVQRNIAALALRVMSPHHSGIGMVSVRENKAGGVYLSVSFMLPLPPHMERRPQEDANAWEQRLGDWYATPQGRVHQLVHNAAMQEIGDIADEFEQHSLRVCRDCGAPGRPRMIDLNRRRVWCDRCAERTSDE